MSDGLVYLDPRELREAETNPRTIKDERFEHLCYTLDRRPELLEARPIVKDAEVGDVPCGNMRLRAALALLERGAPRFTAYVEEHGGVPVYVKTFESEAERREWLTLDNQGFGEWVPDELAAMVRLHAEEGADLAMLGFAQPEVEGLLRLSTPAPAEPEGHGDPDLAPPPPEKPRSKPGDLWQLGDHRVMCADAIDLGALYALIDGDRGIDMIWTDPPYGVGYDAETRVSYFSPERLAQAFGTITNDEVRSVAEYSVWLADVLDTIIAPLREGGAVYLCHADKMVEGATRAYREAGLFYAQQLIWLKTVLVFGRSDYHFKHEPILYGWKPGAAHRWLGDRTHTTIIEAASDHYAEKGEKYHHPTQKPYELIRPCLENSSEPGDVVLDAFGGSGSTLIACERLGREARVIELDPRYVDVIVSRWEAYTGQPAELIRETPLVGPA